MDKKEFRVLTKHCFLMGKNTVDAERSDRPKSAFVPENITKVHKIVLGNRKLKFREIADTLKISEDSVYTILHESLGMRKLFSKLVPRSLSPEQKPQRVKDLESCLELYKRGKKNFLRRYMTMDETWIHHYTLETKRSSAEWTAAGDSRPKRPKTQEWAGKFMASLLWDAYGILFIDFLKKGKTINSNYYIALLDRLSVEIKKKRPHMQEKKVLFHKLNELSSKLLPPPPYSSDLARRNY